MSILTNFLKLLKPEPNDYVDVKTHISDNYDKIDAKLKEFNDSNNKKIDKGNLPASLVDAKGIFDLLENNGGLNIDPNLIFLNDAGTKQVGKVYFDRNKKGLFECIAQTTSTVNSTANFVDISNKASSDRLSNLSIVKTCFEGRISNELVDNKLDEPLDTNIKFIYIYADNGDPNGVIKNIVRLPYDKKSDWCFVPVNIVGSYGCRTFIKFKDDNTFVINGITSKCTITRIEQRNL